MSETKKRKQSSALLNIIVIILGAYFLFLAIIQTLDYVGIHIALPVAVEEFAGLLGSGSMLVSYVLGFWAFIAGFGLFREEEWAMGIGLAILSLMAVVSLSYLLPWFGVATWYTVWTTWIYIVALAISVIGFFYLLITSRRYD
ncbi:MAG: hypothetical protein ACFFBH_11250 [Promethearchaeota archaeon]